MNELLDMESISQNLKKIRIKHNITITKVADYLGMTAQAYGRIELGKNALTLDNAVKLSKLYKTSIEELIILPLNTNPVINECVFSTYVEKDNGIIEEGIDLKLDNFTKSIYAFKNKNGAVDFFESTITPCYNNEMIFIYKKKIIRSIIYKFSSSSFGYIEGDSIVRALIEDAHFLAVKINISEFLK